MGCGLGLLSLEVVIIPYMGIFPLVSPPRGCRRRRTDWTFETPAGQQTAATYRLLRVRCRSFTYYPA